MIDLLGRLTCDEISNHPFDDVLRARQDHLCRFCHQRGQINFFFVNLHNLGFDFRDVEDIANNFPQVISGRFNRRYGFLVL